MSRDSVTGGGSVTIEISVAGAEPRGTTFNLTSSHPTIVPIPATALTPPMISSVRITANTSPVAVDTPVTITAQVGQGLKGTATLQVLAPTISSLTIQPTEISGGSTVTGKIMLNSPAPVGGVPISVSIDSPSAYVSSNRVTVPVGGTTADFLIMTRQVATTTPAKVLVRAAISSKEAILNVLIGVASLTFKPPAPVGGTTSTGTLMLTGPAPTGGALIRLSPPGSSMPGGMGNWLGGPCYPAPVIDGWSVTVPPGSTTADFAVKTFPGLYGQYPLYVSYGNHGRVYNFVVWSASLTNLEIPARLKGGTSAEGILRLSGLTPRVGCLQSPLYESNFASKFTFYLKSSALVVQVPSLVRFGADQTELKFTINTSAVEAEQPVTISVSEGALGAPVKKTGTVVITP